ncbi:UDP-3-O-(3-hydroxymyristoyl)glucosamine N-acyltransferase [Gynuella sp.]|uniref:UDP-3-O-(3-hydroxymyristoyl)glucosamine N-acyltransferase n=1 Tax=Gynuella sp. TaxID=2969146 RepID=UPI003D0C3866
MSLTLQRIAEIVSGTVEGDPTYEVAEIRPLNSAIESSLSFLSDSKYVQHLGDCKAGAVLISADLAAQFAGNRIVVANPYLAYAKVSKLFDPEPDPDVGIHPTAVVHHSVRLGDNVTVEAHAVVEAGSVLGDRVRIGANAVVGANVVIGADTCLYPNVTIYYGVEIGERCIFHSGSVIGSHGFGFANDKGVWNKIAQVGNVVIKNDVEVGTNSTIDRGAIGSTVIGNGVKIDNLVQLGHNVEIGDHTAFASQVGVSGSTKIGSHCMIGGQTGFAGHLQIADGCVFTGQSMVTKSIPVSGMYSSGVPVQPSKEWRKWVARVRNLIDLQNKVKKLEKQMAGNSSD